ncbi:hypothetical protein MVEN_00341800 [Mycena venus]|uniref:Uncharacterized protein n=1 Tax=Mycena venus TaxID=2733690 RepID=A0A8H7D7Y9_9AGAR|nr:hypothetical protein MVEN_00341800 [Mycena venus]
MHRLSFENSTMRNQGSCSFLVMWPHLRHYRLRPRVLVKHPPTWTTRGAHSIKSATSIIFISSTMYLPASLWIPQYSVLHETSYFFSLGQADDDDYFTIIARWLSSAWAAIVSWVKKSFTVVKNWTHDKFPAVVAWLADAAASTSQPIKEHPHTALIVSGFVFLGPQVILLPLFILQAIFLLLLTVLGFGARGIVGGSPAARYQSLAYGGNTPASSLFAILQSIGMKYHTVTLSNWVLAIIRLVAGVVFVYVVLGMTLWW